MGNKKILRGIDTVIIRVSNINRSKQWYQDNLDLPVIWEDNTVKLVVLDTGGPTSLTLWHTDSEINIDKETASYPIFTTADAKEARSELQKIGVNVGELVDDGTVTYFRFFDLDGNVLEACEVHE